MDLLFYGLGGECGFYDAGPQGTLLQEASHRSTLDALRQKDWLLVMPHPLALTCSVSAGRDLESMKEVLIFWAQ